MARVEWSEDAARSLDQLIRTHTLPADTRDRVKRSLRPLERFPLLGPAIGTRAGRELRFILGPWRWMIIVYTVLEEERRVVVVTVEDGRSSSAATAQR